MRIFRPAQGVAVCNMRCKCGEGKGYFLEQGETLFRVGSLGGL